MGAADIDSTLNGAATQLPNAQAVAVTTMTTSTELEQKLSSLQAEYEVEREERKKILLEKQTLLEKRRVEVKTAAMNANAGAKMANGHSEPDATQLQEKIKSTRDEIEALKTEERNHMYQLTQLQTQKAALEEENTTKMEKTEERIETATKLKEAAEAELRSLTASMSPEQAQLVGRVEKLKIEIATNSEDHEKKWKLAQLEAGLAPLQEKIGKLSQEVEVLKAEHENKAERLSKSKELLISLQIELDEEQAAINALVEESEQSLKKQKDDGDEAQKKANEITNQTNQKIDESMQWKNEIQQAEEAKNALAATKGLLLTKKGGIDERLKELQEKNESLNREKLRMEAETKKIENSLGDTREEESTKAAQISKRKEALEKELCVKQKEHDKDDKMYAAQMQKEIQQAEQQASLVQREQLEDAKRACEESKSESEQLRLKIKALEKSLQAEKKKTSGARKGGQNGERQEDLVLA